MNQYPVPWRRDDIDFDVVSDETDHPVVTIVVHTPIGSVRLMGLLEVMQRRATFRGVHVQGPGLRLAGWANVRLAAYVVMKGMNLDGLVIEGGARTNGTFEGRTPRPIRFSPRRADPS